LWLFLPAVDGSVEDEKSQNLVIFYISAERLGVWAIMDLEDIDAKL
jgi:hypothetical protein